MTCVCTTTDLRARDPAGHSYVYQHKLGPQNHNRGGPTAMMHLWPNSDWPVMLCERLATDPRPGRDRFELPVWLDKSLHEISRVTCDRFTTQTQTQTSFIQQKKIQVQYQVYITFMNIQLIISPWHIYDYKHVGRLPLRSYLTADMEATRKGEACTAVMKTAMQLIVN